MIISKQIILLRLKEKHPFFDFSLVEDKNFNYKGTHFKIPVICHEKDDKNIEHGVFYATPHSLLRGRGCPKCKLKKIGDSKRMTKDEFIKKIKKRFGNSFDLSKINYKNNHSKIYIKCKKCGNEFYQKPMNMLDKRTKYPCPFCSKKKYGTKDFIKDAEKVHGTKYDYSEAEYSAMKKKVKIICPKHGEFWQTPYSHLKGRGCPKCTESYFEEQVSSALTKNGIEFIQEKTFDWLKYFNKQRLDFYLPTYNVGIECQGQQHFEPVDFANKGYKWALNNFKNNKKRDENKQKLCEEHNIKIFYINYNENIDKKINDLCKIIKSKK